VNNEWDMYYYIQDQYYIIKIRFFMVFVIIYRVRVIIFNTTFNNISVMSWRSVLLEYPEKTTEKLDHIESSR
jgi:hypothetical protein